MREAFTPGSGTSDTTVRNCWPRWNVQLMVLKPTMTSASSKPTERAQRFTARITR